MTVIVGFNDGTFYGMAADSRSSLGTMPIDNVNKIDTVGRLFVGFAGDTLFRPLIQYQAPPVDYTVFDIGEWCRTLAGQFHEFAEGRGALLEGGIVNTMTLVSSPVGLFFIGQNLAVDHFDIPYFATGSGCDYALGALFASGQRRRRALERKHYVNAVRAAIQFDTGCGGAVAFAAAPVEAAS